MKEDKAMHPAQWCKKMMDEADDGEVAYAYHKLWEMWKERCGTGEPCNQ